MAATNKLSSARIRTLDKPGRYADGNGLYLQVKHGSNGATKSWLFRYSKDKRAHTLGLGSLSVVSLAEARIAAADAQKQLFLGSSPTPKRLTHDAEAQITFKTATKLYIETFRPTWKNKKHATQWINTLSTYAEPVIGSLTVGAIERHHIVRVLKPIWSTKAETATRVRGRIEKILDWAKVEGYRDGDNPAKWQGNLEHALPKRLAKKNTTHLAALPWQEIPDFYQQLCHQDGMAAFALRFTILTAARTGEVRFATYDEFDLESEKPLWIVPAARMKMNREHRVPLTTEAISLVKQAKSNNRFIFSPFAEKAMSENAMLSLLKRMKRTDITVHGFRSTFRDWAADNTEVANDVIETCLAHTNQNQVEAAYLRSDLLNRRSTVMSQWEQFVVR